jgi:phosphotransferase system  glucose/maltose/N-acetylglucosamine-specific IIC component
MRFMETSKYEREDSSGTPTWASLMAGIGLVAAVLGGVIDLVTHGNLPWPEGAFQNPDVLVPVIALLMSFLAVFVLGEVLRLAPRDVTAEDD